MTVVDQFGFAQPRFSMQRNLLPGVCPVRCVRERPKWSSYTPSTPPRTPAPLVPPGPPVGVSVAHANYISTCRILKDLV